MPPFRPLAYLRQQLFDPCLQHAQLNRLGVKTAASGEKILDLRQQLFDLPLQTVALVEDALDIDSHSGAPSCVAG